MNRNIPLNQLAATIGADLGELVQAVKISTFNGVINDTRVDEGRLRGEWQTTTGAPASGESGRIDPTGAAAIAEVRANVTPDGVDYITNPMPYAEVWNERDAIIDKNVARIERNIKEAIKNG